MRRYGIAEFQPVMALIESGLSDSEIAQRTGVGRRSVNGWRHGRGVSYHLRVSRATPAWRPREPAAYAYLLGVYLGDGWITVKSKRAASLVFTLDAGYPGIVEAVILALDGVFPGVPATRHGRMRGSATASRTSQRTFATSSASTATCLGFDGRNPVRAISPLRTAPASQHLISS
jgi:hypothetical protein